MNQGTPKKLATLPKGSSWRNSLKSWVDKVYDGFEVGLRREKVLQGVSRQDMKWNANDIRFQLCDGAYLHHIGDGSASMGCAKGDNGFGPGLLINGTKLLRQVWGSSP